jgi:hypothetical protein
MIDPIAHRCKHPLRSAVSRDLAHRRSIDRLDHAHNNHPTTSTTSHRTPPPTHRTLRVVHRTCSPLALLIATTLAFGCAHDPPPSRNVYFDTKKDEPRAPDDYMTIGRALALLGEYPKLRLLVVGHTDAVGSDEFNRELALRRATNIRGELLAQDPTLVHRIEMAYFGKHRPVADNTTEDGKAKNRRVELYLYYPEPNTATEVQLQRDFGGSLEFEASASASIR